MPDRTRAFLHVLAAYVAALVVAVIVWAALPALPIVPRLFLADVAATLVIFGFSLGYRNSSFYDAYWSVAPPVIVAALWLLADLHPGLREFAVALLVWFWAVRLTFNWASGWRGLDHADWRYVNLAARLGWLYWPVSLLGVHLMPTLLVFIGCLAVVPVYLPVTGLGAPLGWLDGVALLVGISAVWLETRADLELHHFRRSAGGDDDDGGRLLKTGVWAWCRHPNYLGELGFWLSLGLFGLAAGGTVWVLGGLVAMLVLFVFASIPMIENRMLESRPEYAAWRSRSFALLPFSALRRDPAEQGEGDVQ